MVESIGTQFLFHGRQDDQVKIRGNRVEIREIEARISSLAEVDSCYVSFKKVEEDKGIIVAYVIPNKNNPKDTSQANKGTSLKNIIQVKLEEILPNYMIPEQILLLDKFPLNANGKIDKNRLLLTREINQPQGMSQKNLHSSETLSTDELDVRKTQRISNFEEAEAQVCLIFSHLLDGMKVQPEDNLFHLGADSLKILLAIQEIEEKLDLKIELKDVFRLKSVTKILEHLELQGLPKTELSQPKKVAQTSEKCTQEVSLPSPAEFKTIKTNLLKKHPQKIPLSYNQEHLYFLEKYNFSSSFSLEASDDSYYVHLILNFLGKIDAERLNLAINKVIVENPILRTIICSNKDGTEIWQEILEEREDFVSVEEESLDKIEFNLLGSIPVKVKMENDKRVDIYLHHIAIDGKSLAIIGEPTGTALKYKLF